MANMLRIKNNKYYILYKRIKARKDTIPLYAIYCTDAFGGDIIKEYNNKQKAFIFFSKATKEAEEYDKEII